MKTWSIVALALLLPACTATPPGLQVDQLETERYLITERRRLPIDFPEVQKNLFKHERVCGVRYTFEMLPNESAFARVVYRPEADSGWEDAVVLSLVRLHNTTINVYAYSYYPGQGERALEMITAFMKPESCQADRSWENTLDD